MSNSFDDLRDFVSALKADRQTQKEKEQRDAWTKYVSLSTILLAVLAAYATGKGGGYSSATIRQMNEATFNQAEASDQWAYYQAKGIKAAITAEEREVLAASANADPKLLADLGKKVERYGNEQKEIAVEAKKFEAKRDAAREAATHSAAASSQMSIATSVFQIVIALGGITLIMKKRWLWYASLLGGAVATVQMLRVILRA